MPNDAAPAAETETAAMLHDLQQGEATLLVELAGQAGSRRVLGRLRAGEAAFVLPRTDLHLTLLPDPGAEVATRPVAHLAPEQLADVADAWLRMAGEVARDLPVDADVPHGAAGMHRLVPGHVSLPAGARAMPAGREPLWCRVEAGSVATRWGRASGPDDPAPAVLQDAPLTATIDSDVTVLSSRMLAANGRLASALDGFNHAFADALAAALRRDQARSTAHGRAAAAADAAMLGDALAQLAPGEAHQVAVDAAAEPPLVAVLRQAAAATGTQLPSGFGAKLADVGAGDALAVLAAQAGMRLRPVRLPQAWWRMPGEVMIGRQLDGTPVALIPTGRRWRMQPPGTAAVIIDRQVAATIELHARVLYRGFGDTAPQPARSVIRFAWHAMRKDVLLIGTITLLASMLGLATPLLTGMLVQWVIPDGMRGELAQLILALVAVSFGAIGFELARSLAVLRIESILGSSIEGALWDRLLRLPAAFFRRYGVGDLALRADAMNRMRRNVGFATITAVIGVLFSCVNLVFLLSYGLWPALLTLAVCVVEIILLVGLSLFELAIQRRALANGGAMQTLTVQIFLGIAKLRSAAAESRFLARWTRLFATDQALQFRASVAGSAVTAFGAGWNILVMAALIALVGFGAAKMSLGDYVAYAGLSGQFVSAMLSLAALIPALATSLPLWERARPILTEATEDAGGRVQPGVLRGDIEVAHLDFSYPNGPPVLRDVTLTVPAGAFVAVVGPSGSGKSTLLRLLLGFERPDSGVVLLNGHDLRDLDIAAVRRQLGVVLQHSRIEAGSLYQNIVGSSDLSLEDAWEAARLAGLEQDIAAMPMGLHTQVDDSGATISGGQRQRLLLARAIARHPRIMLLDEATSSLDATIQAHVMQTLAHLNVTRVMVAHRLSTVRDADLICVMSEGRIVEQGDYATLAGAGGLFTQLIQRQLA